MLWKCTGLMLLICAQQPDAVDAPDARAGDLSETREDAEIMRRILAQSLARAARPAPPPQPGQWPDVTGQVHTTAVLDLFQPSAPVTHSRAFELPGGLLFTFDVTVPVKTVSQRDPAAGREEDAWEQARRELQGGGGQGGPAVYQVYQAPRTLYGGVPGSSSTRPVLDPEPIDAVRSSVLVELARHAERIRGLRGDEKLTVAIHFSAADDPLSLNTGQPWTGTWMSFGHEAPDRHMVIEVPLRDAVAATSESELGRRAVVHQY